MGIRQVSENLLSGIYEGLGRPRYAIGHLLGGDPGAAVRTMLALRRLTPEEKFAPSEALGMKEGIGAKALDLFLDPVLWLGFAGVSKLAGKLPSGRMDPFKYHEGLGRDLTGVFDAGRGVRGRSHHRESCRVALKADQEGE